MEINSRTLICHIRHAFLAWDKNEDQKPIIWYIYQTTPNHFLFFHPAHPIPPPSHPPMQIIASAAALFDNLPPFTPVLPNCFSPLQWPARPWCISTMALLWILPMGQDESKPVQQLTPCSSTPHRIYTQSLDQLSLTTSLLIANSKPFPSSSHFLLPVATSRTIIL